MYRLSNYIELIKDYIPENNELEYNVVQTRKKSKIFLINEVIFNFLKHFELPTTFNSVLAIYAKQLNLNSEKDLNQLKGQLQSFFNKVKGKKWIVKEVDLEPKIDFSAQLKVNDDISKYAVKEVIANKKITDLYLVKRKYDAKLFVIKLLNRSKFNDSKSFDSFKNHFISEYGFLAKFNSHYINKTYGIEQYKNQPFIVLEYINGVSLHEFIKKNTISANDKLALIFKILKGFSIIHKANVFHGDIHLSNIIIKKGNAPKIIDFGYANSYNSEQKIRNGGVYAFIPPERALRSIEHRFTKVSQYQSEVYQIGLLIYYIYMKKLPFESETWKRMVDEKKAFNIKTFQPFLDRRMPNKVRRFTIKCLETHPENRFDNAQQMHNEWKKIISKQ